MNEVVITIRGNDQFTGVARKTSAEAKGLGTTLGSVSKIAGGFVLGQGLMEAPRIIGSFASAASDLNETLNKSRVVFGEHADAMEDWASGAAKSMGQSKNQALGAAATFGNLFDAMGLTEDASADMSRGLVQLASDLSSFNNVPIDEALVALRAGLVGEVEPMRRLGVQINAATVDAKALEMGLADANGEISEAAKVQARYALTLEQTTNAQGDFARTSEGLANQQRILKAQWADLQAQIGQGLIPVMTELVTALNQVAQAVTTMDETWARWREDTGLLGSAIRGIELEMKALHAAISAVVDVLRPLVNAIRENDAAMMAFKISVAAAVATFFLPIAAFVGIAIALDKMRVAFDAVRHAVDWLIERVRALISALDAIPSFDDVLPDIPGIGLGGLIQKGKGILGFQHGTPFVPTDTLALLHRGERVVPAAENARLMLGSAEAASVVINATFNVVPGEDPEGFARRVLRILRDELQMDTLTGPRLAVGAFSPRRA